MMREHKTEIKWIEQKMRCLYKEIFDKNEIIKSYKSRIEYLEKENIRLRHNAN